MCAVTGEASSIAMKDELRRCMRELSAASAIIFDRYGSTELGAFAQCRENGDWHNPAPEIQYHEVVDADTGRRLPDGERGALAVTYLDRRGTVLIRFLIGDHVSIARGPCPECGRTVERVVGPVVRVSDLVKVKGMLINPAVVLECLQGMPEVDEFQVVIRRQDAADPFSMDEMVVRVAARSTASAPLAETIAAYIQDAVHVRPRVEFTSADRIYQPDCQPKAVRFVDQR